MSTNEPTAREVLAQWAGELRRAKANQDLRRIRRAQQMIERHSNPSYLPRMPRG
jgi:hypothetical protein